MDVIEELVALVATRVEAWTGGSLTTLGGRSGTRDDPGEALSLHLERHRAAIARWLAESAQSPLDIPGKPLREQRLEFERKDIQLLFFALVGAIPGLVALMGGLVWIRRRS